MKDLPDVKLGQVWADNDKRAKGRRVLVVGLDATHATCSNHPQDFGRRYRIRLDRFRPTSTGYRLESDVRR
jgi:hypothetical protein